MKTFFIKEGERNKRLEEKFKNFKFNNIGIFMNGEKVANMLASNDYELAWYNNKKYIIFDYVTGTAIDLINAKKIIFWNEYGVEIYFDNDSIKKGKLWLNGDKTRITM